MCPQDDPRTCKFIRSKDQYESYLRGLDAEHPLETTGEGLFFWDANTEMVMQLIELKEQVDNIKEQLHGNVVDISTLKMQRNDMKLFGMDTSVAFVCLLV